MKKVLSTLFFSFLLLFSFSKVAWAGKQEIVKEQNGRKCVDLTAYYEGVNNTSQAITGKAQSLDSVKKADHIATFTNIISFFVGNSIYCINDEVAASKTDIFKDRGVLGMLNEGSFSLLSSLPRIGVADHLAQEFVPGYKGNNATFANEKTPSEVETLRKNFAQYKGINVSSLNESNFKKYAKDYAHFLGKTLEGLGIEDYLYFIGETGIDSAEEGGRISDLLEEIKNEAYFGEDVPITPPKEEEVTCNSFFTEKYNCTNFQSRSAGEIGETKCYMRNYSLYGNACMSLDGLACCCEKEFSSGDTTSIGLRKFYNTESECMDPAEQTRVEEEFSKAYSNKDGIKEKIIDALLWYLGLGSLDRDEMKRLKQVEHKNGYDYLKTLNLDVLWSVTRNLAYLFFVVVMIVIGFMIMFRNKIGGQIMVTVGNSIPKVVICLVLVTFSFAISGILLDLGRVSMNLVNNLIVNSKKELNLQSVDIASIENMSDQAIYQLKQGGDVSILKDGEDDLVGDAVKREIKKGSVREEKPWLWYTSDGFAEIVLRTGGAFILQGIREANIGPIADIVADIVITGIQIPNISRLLTTSLFLLVAAYASFKLFLTIFVTYIKIFVSVVIGPIQIALGAIPGNTSSINNWLKTLASHVLVFPVVVAIIGFAQFLGAAIDPKQFSFFGTEGVFLPEGLVALKGVFFVGGYFFAASAPNMIKGFMKIEEDKTLSAAGASVKQSMSKIPMIGGIFGK